MRGLDGSNMTMPAKLSETETLYWTDLKSLCMSAGPCITISLPAFHQGAQALSYAIQLKAALRVSQHELIKRCPPQEVETLMTPIREMAEDPEMLAGGGDVVIFRSPTLCRRFRLPGPIRGRTVVARYFHLLPFLDQLCVDREFYILAISQKKPRLLHYADRECQEVPLPAALPHNVEEAGAFDAPDHMLRNHSGAERSFGSMSGVSFGTGSEREKDHERLHHFFRLLDQGLSGFLKGQPLLLSGVGYEVSIYRRAATYPHLLETNLEGDLHILSLKEIACRAYESARDRSRRQAGKQLNQLREMAGTARISSDIRQVVKAGEEGRVAKLIFAEQAEFGATLEALESDSPEDLLNAAAVLSIRSGAEVFMLPAAMMAAEGPVAAIFRF